MTPPTVRGVGAFGSGTTSFTAAVPTGGNAPQSGDAMYIIVESSDSTTTAGTPNTPSGGWDKLAENTIAGGLTNVSTLTIFGKFAGVGEGNVTVDGVLNHCSGAMIVIADHGLIAITDTVVGTPTDHGVGIIGLITASITVIADSLIIQTIGFSDDAADTTNHSGQSNANLANGSEKIDQTVATGAGGGIGIWTATCAGTSTGATTWAHDTAVQSQSLHLGIRPKAVLVVQEATHAHTADALGLIQHNSLAVVDALHSLFSETPTLSVHGTGLTVQSTSHQHTADGVSLVVKYVLGVSDANHGLSSDFLSLIQHNILSVSDALHVHLADTLNLYIQDIETSYSHSGRSESGTRRGTARSRR